MFQWAWAIKNQEIRLTFTKLLGIIAYMKLRNYCLILKGLSMGKGINMFVLFDPSKKMIAFKRKLN